MTSSNGRALKPARLTSSWLDDAAAQLGLSKSGFVARVIANGLVPPRTRAFPSIPDPAGSYDEASRRFEALSAAESGLVAPLCVSRLFSHGRRTKKAYVLIHGLTNSPVQFHALGQMLHDCGHNVYIPLLPLHGRLSNDVRELAPLMAEDLRDFADRAADLAAGLGDTVNILGVSGGANVAVWMAQYRLQPDATALLIAPFFNAAGVPTFVSRILLSASVRLPNVAFEDTSTARRDWVYRGQSSRGVAAVWELIRSVAARARAGARPAGRVIVLTTAMDDTAANRSTLPLIDDWRWAGAEVDMVEFDRDMGIAHNSLDPAADPAKRQIVHARIMALFGETVVPTHSG